MIDVCAGFGRSRLRCGFGRGADEKVPCTTAEEEEEESIANDERTQLFPSTRNLARVDLIRPAHASQDLVQELSQRRTAEEEHE